MYVFNSNTNTVHDIPSNCVLTDRQHHITSSEFAVIADAMRNPDPKAWLGPVNTLRERLNLAPVPNIGPSSPVANLKTWLDPESREFYLATEPAHDTHFMLHYKDAMGLLNNLGLGSFATYNKTMDGLVASHEAKQPKYQHVTNIDGSHYIKCKDGRSSPTVPYMDCARLDGMVVANPNFSDPSTMTIYEKGKFYRVVEVDPQDGLRQVNPYMTGEMIRGS